ncbi:MAG: hypothetical protein U9N76_04850 [Candidatus Marinimicrobia bacterium]|nr:hypothetical protein [Candidatus Neomarinimicrobiota bacterium]
MKKTISYLFTIIVILFVVSSLNAQTKPTIGIRGGVGTDINLGLAYGLGINYLLPVSDRSLELGILLFGGKSKESTDIGIHTYNETTEIFVVALMFNYLINYFPETNGVYFISGAGVASIGVEWEEKSQTDISLGTPLPGGGSMQSAEGTTGGIVLNLGVGKSFNNKLDVRIELPMIIIFSTYGGASNVAPSLITTAGYRF